MHHDGRKRFGGIDSLAASKCESRLRLSSPVRILSALEDLGTAGTGFDRAVLRQNSGVTGVQEIQNRDSRLVHRNRAFELKLLFRSSVFCNSRLPHSLQWTIR